MVDDRVLKFHIQILHEKNSWPVVFFMYVLCPLLE